jgi:hypothetical protein
MDTKAWRQKLAEAREQMRLLSPQHDDDISTTIAVAGPVFVAAVCIRDHWPEMSPDEQRWCAAITCDSLKNQPNDETSVFTGSPIEGSVATAYVLPSLFGKDLGEKIERRLLPTLAATLTHGSNAVIKAVAQGIGAYLWKVDRSLALTCIQAFILEAFETDRLLGEERARPLDERLSREEFALAIKNRLWQFVEARSPADPKSILETDFTGEPWQNAAENVFTILSRQAGDSVAIEVFGRSARDLVARWMADDEESGAHDEERELDISIEHLFVDSLVQFVLQLPPAEALQITDPICQAANRFPKKVSEYVKWLIMRQGDRAPAPTLWCLWQKFADDFCAGNLPGSVDEEHSGSGQLLHELFLGDNWGNVREWAPLKGEEQRVRRLFDNLPPSRKALEEFSYFLAHTGTPSLPGSIVSIGRKLSSSNQNILSGVAVFYLETILTRLIYTGSGSIRNEADVRAHTIATLDAMVAAGSSVAYKLRDDFVTPDLSSPFKSRH